jgi:hypothetical protein
MAETKNAAALLKDQKERLERLRERRTSVAVELGSKKQQFATACEEARKEFGTDNLDELRALYARREAENDELVMGLVLQLDEVEQQLAAVERQLKG